jgi:hypothetical protein
LVSSLYGLFNWGKNLSVSDRAHWEALFDGTLSAADLDGLRTATDVGPLKAKLDKSAREAEEWAAAGLPSQWFSDSFHMIVEWPEPRTPGVLHTSPVIHFVPKMGLNPDSHEARLLKDAYGLGPSSLGFTKPKVRPCSHPTFQRFGRAYVCLLLSFIR